MTRHHRCGVAVAALMISSAEPVLAQDEATQPLYELRPGTVLVLVPETGVTYQLPVTLAVEVCPDIDEAYLVSDFQGTTEVVCEVPETVAVEYDFESRGNDDDDDAAVAPTEPTEPTPPELEPAGIDAETDDDGQGAVDDGVTGTDGAVDADTGTDTDAGTDVDAGDDTGVEAGVEPEVDAGTDAGTDDDTGTDAGTGVDAGDDAAGADDAGTDAGSDDAGGDDAGGDDAGAGGDTSDSTEG